MGSVVKFIVPISIWKSNHLFATLDLFWQMKITPAHSLCFYFGDHENDCRICRLNSCVISICENECSTSKIFITFIKLLKRLIWQSEF